MKSTECERTLTEAQKRKWGRQCGITHWARAQKRKPIIDRMVTREPEQSRESATNSSEQRIQ